MATKLVNGVAVELTAGEITAREAEEAAWEASRLTEARANATLDRFEFLNRAVAAGHIAAAAVLAMSTSGIIPAAVEAIIDAQPVTDAEKALLRLDVLQRPEFKRNGALMPAIAASFETDAAGLDALFGIA